MISTAWRLLCPGAKLWAVVWGRLVREGGVNILPLSEFGGLAFGARAVALAGEYRGGPPAGQMFAGSAFRALYR